MKKLTMFMILFSLPLLGLCLADADNKVMPNEYYEEIAYTVGVNDILEISIIQPDELTKIVTVSPDGIISFPYIGSIDVRGMTLSTIQGVIQSLLADGYMKYPIVSVFLTESRSRKYFVYGEVNEPGSYPLEENTTILRAIAISSGFTKYGSSNKVRLLRTRENQPGYETVKVNIKDIMNGKAGSDLILKSGDIIVVSDGAFR